MSLDDPDKSEWKTTAAVSAVSKQPNFSLLSHLLHLAPKPSAEPTLLLGSPFGFNTHALISTHP